MIQSHAPSAKIIAYLEQQGHPGINAVNITHWVRGNRCGSSGYQDWQRERRALAELRAQEEFALELVKQNHAHSLHDASRLLANQAGAQHQPVRNDLRLGRRFLQRGQKIAGQAHRFKS